MSGPIHYNNKKKMHRQLDVLNYKQITTLCRVARFPAGLQLHSQIQCHWPWTQPCIPVWVASYKSPYGIWALVKPCRYMVWWSVKGSVGRRPGVVCTQWVVHPTCPSQSEHLDQMHSLHPSRWHNRTLPEAHFVRSDAWTRCTREKWLCSAFWKSI